MKLNKKEKQELLEAKLRAIQIKKKEKAMQVRTGAADLSSSYERIKGQLEIKQSIYGYVRDLNKGMKF